MRSHIFTAISALVLLLACGNDEGSSTSAPGTMPRSRGEMIFNTHCTLCHGADGRLGIAGAKDLSVSPLSREEMMTVVLNGRGTMMPYRNVLKANEIEAVVDHVRSLGEME